MEVEITQGDIEIEEMPQGCVLSQKRGGKWQTVVVGYPDDAVAIIESLCKMIAIQHPEYLPNIACSGLAGTARLESEVAQPANR